MIMIKRFENSKHRTLKSEYSRNMFFSSSKHIPLKVNTLCFFIVFAILSASVVIPANADEISRYGDVDGDEKISAKDSMAIQRYTINLTKLSDDQFRAADVNGDNKVTSKDSLEILRYSVNLNVSGRTGLLISEDQQDDPKAGVPDDLKAYIYPFDIEQIVQDIKDYAEIQGMIYDSTLVCIDRHFDEYGNDLGNAGWTFPRTIVNSTERYEGDATLVRDLRNAEYNRDLMVYSYVDHLSYVCHDQWLYEDWYYDWLNEHNGEEPPILFNIECEESPQNVFTIYIPYDN